MVDCNDQKYIREDYTCIGEGVTQSCRCTHRDAIEWMFRVARSYKVPVELYRLRDSRKVGWANANGMTGVDQVTMDKALGK